MNYQKELPLTSYARSGGCSCKLPPSQLADLLASQESEDNAVTGSQGDDAAIISLGDGKVMAQSVDFQTPIVDDPELAGKIAAANALSDLLACGIAPQYADVILALPDTGKAVTIGRAILNGIAQACKTASCQVVGGHTILTSAPIIGLAVTGIGLEANIKRKSGALLHDKLLLTKPIGSGIAISARQMGIYIESTFRTALESLQSINLAGTYLGSESDVHAMTDITGFGLAGHLCEIALQSKVSIQITFPKVPQLPRIVAAAREGATPRIAGNTLEAFNSRLCFEGPWESIEHLLCCAPETNGGLLVAVAPSAVARVQENLTLEFGVQAIVIGSITDQFCTDMGRVTFTK